MQGTQITDAGLEHLKGMSKLRYLDLQETRITDAGLDIIKGWSQLRRLTFASWQITYERVQKLKEEMPHCKSSFLDHAATTDVGQGILGRGARNGSDRTHCPPQ